MGEIILKGGSITNLTDARYFAAQGVHWLGFNLNSSDRDYIRPDVIQEIKQWVEGIKFVGQFGLAEPNSILEVIKGLQLDFVELSYLNSIDTIKQVKEVCPVILNVVLEPSPNEKDLVSLLSKFNDITHSYLIDLEINDIPINRDKNNYSAGEINLNWICNSFPVIINYHKEDPDILQILQDLSIYGLNLKGGEEEKVGFKSYEELDIIFDKIQLEL